jgi:hypothetical protein
MREQLSPDDGPRGDVQPESELLMAPASGRRWKQQQQQQQQRRPGPEEWRTLAALWAMGFCLNCKPSEPYLSKYIMEDKGVSEDDLNHSVYPFSTYGSLIFLLPVGMLAEHVGYRTVIIGGLICRELTRVLLIYASGVAWMATMQLTYAGSVAANSIFFAYAYVIVPPRHYALATGGVHAAYHTGNFVGSMVGELLVSQTAVSENLQVLFYISWLTTTTALLIFVLCVPSPRLRPPPSIFSMLREQPNGKARAAAEMRALYTSRQVRLTSLWWMLGSASTSLCMNVFQTYFYTLDSEAPFGAIEGGLELLMAAGAAAVALPAMGAAVATRSTELLGGSAVLTAVLVGIGTWQGEGGETVLLVWVVLPIICAMGLSGAQEALASAAIAAALGGGSTSSSVHDAEGTAHGGTALGCANGRPPSSPQQQQPQDDEEAEEEQQQRFAVIFPLNAVGSLVLASSLQLGCAQAECSTVQYLWLAVLGNLLTAAALMLASEVW